MASWLVFNPESSPLFAAELPSARLLGVEMVKAGFPGNYFSGSGDFQPLGI